MAIQQHVQKLGAHPSQETRPCGSNSQKPTVAPDSQPPSGRKRKHRALSPDHRTSQSTSSDRSNRSKRRKTSSNSSVNSSTHTSFAGSSWSRWDKAEREYWASLSKVLLTSDSLREFNRQNPSPRIETLPIEETEFNLKQHPADLTRFARQGGPDLSDIINIRNPFFDDSAFSSLSSMPRKGKSEKERKRSSAYDGNFQQHLADNGILPASRAQRAANHGEWLEVTTRARSSPSRSDDASYLSFVRAADGIKDESEVMSQVFPRLIGRSKHATASNIPFNHLDQITRRIVIPQPDMYQGETPGVGNRTLRKRLAKAVVPSSRKDRPFLPTYFAEAKGPEGSHAVARRQACHDGAAGTRVMHSLQSLGGTGDYDGNAYVASAIYSGDGYLDLHTHHMTQPKGRGSLPNTHMTPLRGICMMDSPQSYREARDAFRNVGDHAHEYRVQFLNDANRRNGIVSPPPPTTRSRSSHTPLSFQVSPPPPKTRSRSSLTPLSFQTSVAEESDSASDSDKSDVGYQIKEPTLRRKKHARESSGSEPGNESDVETSAPRGRQAQNPVHLTITPPGTNKRDPSRKRTLRPRKRY